MSACRFTHDSSIETINGGFWMYRSNGTVEVYNRLDDVSPESEVVNLDEGLVHLFGSGAVYEIRFDREADFVISKLAIR